MGRWGGGVDRSPSHREHRVFELDRAGQAINKRTAESPRCVSTLRLISHADISQKQLILAAAFCHVGICRCSLPWESALAPRRYGTL
jgi:hypothetical protein